MFQDHEHHTLELIRQTALAEKLHISKMTLWRLENQDPNFPKRYSVGKRGVAYRVTDVTAWLASRES